MASSSSSSWSFPLVSLCYFLLIVSLSLAKLTSFHPKAIVLQVTKDARTLQHVTQVSLGTPLVPVKLTIDLGGEYMWVNCDPYHPISYTYTLAPCGSAPCKLLNTTQCATTTPLITYMNDTCRHFPLNPVANTEDENKIGSDVLMIQSKKGNAKVTIPRFTFLCGRTFLLDGLASGVTGMAGLGRTEASLPSQFSSHFGFHKKFTLCLSSSTRSNGVMIFGNGSYSYSFTYTSLITNHVTHHRSFFDYVGYGDASPKYFIGVKSIKVNGKRVRLHKSLLSINGTGYGGTTISTTTPYTVMETSIFEAVARAFVRAMPKNVDMVLPVGPFRACFDSKNIGYNRMGPNVPSITLVLQKKRVYWRIYGANLMVEPKKGVLCLGIIEPRPTDFQPLASIVIGAQQIEDHLLEFDLSASRLGFSSSLLGGSNLCANLNFTS